MDLRNQAAGDGLRAVRDDVFRNLARAISDRASPYRTPTLGTVAAGHPRLRTVVLRSVDPDGRFLSVHTDVRAAKVHELRGNPHVALHVWDAAAQVQVRLDGVATLHHHDRIASEAWAGLHPRTRATYSVDPAPGTVLASPEGYSAPDRHDARAEDNFAVIALGLHGMDWLCLAGPKHRRAKWTWHGGNEDADWVVP